MPATKKNSQQNLGEMFILTVHTRPNLMIQKASVE